MDKKISCLGLLLGAALTFAAVSIPTYQIVLWLLRGTWHAVALENTPASLIRCLGRSWIGLQIVYGWVLAIPATLGLALLAFGDRRFVLSSNQSICCGEACGAAQLQPPFFAHQRGPRIYEPYFCTSNCLNR